jgi:sirohydrochlorin ferrochelatase
VHPITRPEEHTMREHDAAVDAANVGDAERGKAQRLLVVANETLAGEGAVHAIEELIARGARVLVVTPVLISRARYWTSDLSAGIERARERLAESLASLRARGIDADGTVGDGHPLLAIEDALRHFRADHLLIITHPPGRSNWLEHRLVEHADERFDLAVSHAVVDLGAAGARAWPVHVAHV